MSVKDIAQKELEKHYLSTIYDDVTDLEENIKNNEVEIKILEDGGSCDPNEIGITNLERKIVENKARISSTHKACQGINKGLESFLGRDEIVFEVSDEGYVIKRNGKIADDLSEGEKTAITFVYFTVHLRDQDFDVKEGIVVVDDPVSSFDSNSLFQAFAFLKNAVKDAKQIFILTHSFDFLRLLLNWAKHIPNKGGNKSYYMIKNRYLNNERQAYIAAMDKELKDYESEYHYLFKLLYTFQSDETIGRAYPIPNIARKALETFLMFRVPNGDKPYKKMEVLKPFFDENKLTAIYKFTNELSHITGKGFDPALVPETQKNVKYLLEMMETVFPEHYKILVESISPCPSMNQT
jgi:wobble nucleotide-excising tRNase